MQEIFYLKFFQRQKFEKDLINQTNIGKKPSVHFPENENVLGLYEVENINDPCYVTLAVNPKEYFEYFESEKCNKNPKGIKKGAKRMGYENYAERIKPIIDFKSYQKPKADIKSEARISVKKGEMTKHLIKKNIHKFKVFTT